MPKRNKRPQQELRPRFHIYCEGAKTEPFYFERYIQKRFPGAKLIKIEPTKKNTAKQLVQVACKAQKSAPAGDIFWVVYDRECPGKYSDALHAEARQKAKGKVEVAISNVCFEIWLLLHFQPTCKAHDCYDDLRAHSPLKKYIPNYDKADRREYSDEEIAQARQHAERMNESTKRGANPEWTQPHQWNPYTDVHKLLDAIDEFGKKNIERKS